MRVDSITRNKVLKSLIFLFIGALTFSIIGDFLSDINTYKQIISVLDNKIQNVFALILSTTGVSVALGSLSDLPMVNVEAIANQLVNMNGYLVIVLSILYLEKYLLTIIGFVVYKVVIPLSCILGVICVYSKNSFKKFLSSVLYKVVLFSIVLSIFIPCSVWVTHNIDQTYQTSVDMAIEEMNNSTADSLKESIINIKNKVQTWIRIITEYVAVLIVTSCLIPILTFLIFNYFTNIIFNTNLGIADIENKSKRIGTEIQRLTTVKENDHEIIDLSEEKNTDER